MKILSLALLAAALALPLAANAQTSGQAYCREYQRTIAIDGRPERAYGTACQEPDGNWRVVSEDSGQVPVNDEALYVEPADLVGVAQPLPPQYTYVEQYYVPAPAPVFTSLSFGYSNWSRGDHWNNRGGWHDGRWGGGHWNNGPGWNHGPGGWRH